MDQDTQDRLAALLDRIEDLERKLKDSGGGDRLERLDQSQAHQAEALYNVIVFVGEPLGRLQNIVDAKTHINAVNTGKFLFPPKADPAEPKPTLPQGPARVFSVWTGAAIPKKYQSVRDIADDIKTLAMRTGKAWDTLEWIVKAGEAGDWEYTWDKHPLTPASLGDVELLIQQGHEAGITVIPYVNPRGHTEWNRYEWLQIAGLAGIAERVVLNLEPGDKFWDAPGGKAISHHVGWWDGLREILGPSQTPFELAAIPREGDISRLGGTDAIRVWLAECQYASWECYANLDAALRPDIAIPFLYKTLGITDPNKLIPICVFSGFEWWVKNDLANVRDRLQVWTINAD